MYEKANKEIEQFIELVETSLKNSDIAIKACKKFQNKLDEEKLKLSIIQNELDSFYKSHSIFYRTLALMFPRQYDFRRDNFVL